MERISKILVADFYATHILANYPVVIYKVNTDVFILKCVSFRALKAFKRVFGVRSFLPDTEPEDDIISELVLNTKEFSKIFAKIDSEGLLCLDVASTSEELLAMIVILEKKTILCHLSYRILISESKFSTLVPSSISSIFSLSSLSIF